MEESHTTYIPEDMLVQIFLKLPVKSLVLLRCVCKSWYRIIGSSSFINASISNSHTKYILCTHFNFYSLISREESTHCIVNYYMPELFARDKRFYNIKFNNLIKVYGTCNGLLCVSDFRLDILGINSDIYLLNPIIRKAKKLPNIPSQVDNELPNPSHLCFGFFNNDYKVIKIVASCGVYRVGVYSLSTNCWKIMNCNSDDGTFVLYAYPWAEIFNGVAYFLKYRGRIVCFDLHDERIRELKFPEKFNPATWNVHRSFSIEFCGGSIALIEISQTQLTKWVLRNCVAANTSIWEKEVSVELQTTNKIYPIGFTTSGTYMLRSVAYSGSFYIWDLGMSQIKDFVWDAEGAPDLLKIDYLAENLVLLDEETLDPVVEMMPCSTHTAFMLHERPGPRKKKEKKISRKRLNQLQGGRRGKRKIVSTETEKKVKQDTPTRI